LEAEKSKNSAIGVKRTEDRQSKEAGFDEPQGGYMNGGPGTGDASPAPANRRLISGSRHLIHLQDAEKPSGHVILIPQSREKNLGSCRIKQLPRSFVVRQ
jgi:hypothetical protein